MIVVRNVGLCNVRINLDPARRFLIPVGGAESVELPDEVKNLSFFQDRVNDGSLVIERDEPDQDDAEPEQEEPKKKRGRPAKEKPANPEADESVPDEAKA